MHVVKERNARLQMHEEMNVERSDPSYELRGDPGEASCCGAVGSSAKITGESPYQQLKKVSGKIVAIPEPEIKTLICFDAKSGHISTGVHLLGNLEPGTRLPGPALILDKTQTILVSPGCVATVLDSTVMIDLAGPGNKTTNVSAVATGEEVNPIKLSIFGHR